MRKFLLHLCFLTWAAVAAPQMFTMPDERGSAITVQMLFPAFEDRGYFSYSGMIVVLSGKAALTDALSLKAELPYIQSTVSLGSASRSGGQWQIPAWA